MNAKISVFVTCLEVIIYLLLNNLRDCTFKRSTFTIDVIMIMIMIMIIIIIIININNIIIIIYKNKLPELHYMKPSLYLFQSYYHHNFHLLH